MKTPTPLRRSNVTWIGRRLVRKSGQPALLAEIIPDTVFPTMWRFRLMPNGELSDRLNLLRARDAAAEVAIGTFNKQLGLTNVET